jgi:hypothetical protein
MGVVCKARQLCLVRLAALEAISYGDDAGRGEKERFRSETQAAERAPAVPPPVAGAAAGEGGCAKVSTVPAKWWKRLSRQDSI